MRRSAAAEPAPLDIPDGQSLSVQAHRTPIPPVIGGRPPRGDFDLRRDDRGLLDAPGANVLVSRASW